MHEQHDSVCLAQNRPADARLETLVVRFPPFFFLSSFPFEVLLRLQLFSFPLSVQRILPAARSARHVVATDGAAVVFCTIDLVDLHVSLGMMVDSIGWDFPIDWEV